MHRVDEQGEPRGRLRLATLVLPVVTIAIALAVPAFASADLVALEVEREGGGSGTVTSSPAGISCGGTCEAPFEEGKEVTLTAKADAESEFVEWGGCDSEPEGKCKVTMNEPRAVVATFEEFEPPEYTLEVEEEGNGEGEWECLVDGEEEFCGGEYPAGTHIKFIHIEPYEGSKFSGFGGDCTGTSCSLTMDEDHNVTVIFTLKEFTLTVKKNGGSGSGEVECELEVGPEPCQPKYPWESAVTLIAIAKPGSEFVKWEGCDKQPEPGLCEVEIDEEKTYVVTATFTLIAKPKFKLTVKKTGTGTGKVTSSPAGIDCGSTCSFEFESGKVVGLTPSADAGSEFVSWSGACTGSGACNVTMSAAKEVTATFNLKPVTPTVYYKLEVKKEGAGAVTSSPAGIDCGGDCSEKFPAGSGVTLTATPAQGSTFKRWSGVEGSCALERVCKTNIGGDKVVKAIFSDAEPPPSADAMGKVKVVRRIAPVRGGRAQLALLCTGGSCKGGLKLLAKLKGRAKSLVIGKRSFNLAPGAKTTIRVKLSGLATREIAKRRGLKARVQGGGVVGSTVMLKGAQKSKR